ncbi:MAG: DUF3108 domain-containing protein [Gammaproteobacteria bacterium]|jgi:hypothetical protein
MYLNHPMRCRRAGWLLMLVCCLAGARPASDLASFEASYKISRSGIVLGEIRVRFQLEPDGRYHHESITEVTGIVSWFHGDRVQESSRGYMDQTGIHPDYYRFLRSGDEYQKLAEIHFDWESGQVENVVDGQPWKMSIPEGTLDKLVVQIATMRSLQENLRDQHFKVADGGWLKDYRIHIHERATLEVPAGRFETVKIEKESGDKRRQTYLWLAPALGFLPVQIMRTESDGAVYYSELESFSESLRRPDPG